MSRLFENTLANRLLTGALLLATTGFEIGCKSDHHKPADIYGATTVVSSDATIIQHPLEYAKQTAAASPDQQMRKTATTILKMAEQSENLDRKLADQNNNSPEATLGLKRALKEFEANTFYKVHVHNSGRSPQCYEPGWHKQPSTALLNACAVRGAIDTETGDIVMDDAYNFQSQGITNAKKFDDDAAALRTLVVRADKVTLPLLRR